MVMLCDDDDDVTNNVNNNNIFGQQHRIPDFESTKSQKSPLRTHYTNLDHVDTRGECANYRNI